MVRLTRRALGKLPCDEIGDDQRLLSSRQRAKAVVQKGRFWHARAANQYGVGLGEPIPAPVGMDSIKLDINGYLMK